MIAFRSYLKIFYEQYLFNFYKHDKKSVEKPFVITIDLSAFLIDSKHDF